MKTRQLELSPLSSEDVEIGIDKEGFVKIIFSDLKQAVLFTDILTFRETSISNQQYITKYYSQSVQNEVTLGSGIQKLSNPNKKKDADRYIVKMQQNYYDFFVQGQHLLSTEQHTLNLGQELGNFEEAPILNTLGAEVEYTETSVTFGFNQGNNEGPHKLSETLRAMGITFTVNDAANVISIDIKYKSKLEVAHKYFSNLVTYEDIKKKDLELLNNFIFYVFNPYKPATKKSNTYEHISKTLNNPSLSPREKIEKIIVTLDERDGILYGIGRNEESEQFRTKAIEFNLSQRLHQIKLNYVTQYEDEEEFEDKENNSSSSGPYIHNGPNYDVEDHRLPNENPKPNLNPNPQPQVTLPTPPPHTSILGGIIQSISPSTTPKPSTPKPSTPKLSLFQTPFRYLPLNIKRNDPSNASSPPPNTSSPNTSSPPPKSPRDIVKEFTHALPTGPDLKSGPGPVTTKAAEFLNLLQTPIGAPSTQEGPRKNDPANYTTPPLVDITITDPEGYINKVISSRPNVSLGLTTEDPPLIPFPRDMLLSTSTPGIIGDSKDLNQTQVTEAPTITNFDKGPPSSPPPPPPTNTFQNPKPALYGVGGTAFTLFVQGHKDPQHSPPPEATRSIEENQANQSSTLEEPDNLSKQSAPQNTQAGPKGNPSIQAVAQGLMAELSSVMFRRREQVQPTETKPDEVPKKRRSLN